MGRSVCEKCGALVNEQATGCPACGADPRTGVVPEHVKRWETEGEVWREAAGLFERFCDEAMSTTLPATNDLLSACEARADALLMLLPETIGAWRTVWEERAPRLGRDAAIDHDAANRALLAIVGSVYEACEDPAGQTVSQTEQRLAARTELAHRAQGLLHLEYTRLRWRLERDGVALDDSQEQRLLDTLVQVGPLLTPHGLGATLAWCTLHPGSRWETPSSEALNDCDESVPPY